MATLTNYNFRVGIDRPQWEWLAPSPVATQLGASNCYDGVRYIYWSLQSSSTSAVGTTQLYRYDTWLDGWQYLAALTSGGAGIDLEYDAVRQVVIILIAAASSTEWRYFNPTNTPIVYLNQTIQPMMLSAAITPVLPAVPATGSSICMPDDVTLPAVFDTGVVAVGATATSIQSNNNVVEASFHPLLIGLMVEMTSGTYSGQKRTITACPASNTLTVAPALAGVPAAGDTFNIVLPSGTATSGSTTTLVMTGANWPVNMYGNSDVEITAGVGAGQRRRIASNTADTLTLSAATAGNARTGPWTTAPNATSVFTIKPSSDFLYYQPGTTGTAFYRLDTKATTPTWTAMTAVPASAGGGSDLKYSVSLAPFHLMFFRGNTASPNGVYNWSIGANTWSPAMTAYWGPTEFFGTGSNAQAITGKRRMMIFKEGSQRSYIWNIITGMLEPGATLPYAAPTSLDGKRTRYVKLNGVDWMYFLRCGGTEFFRLPIEWL